MLHVCMRLMTIKAVDTAVWYAGISEPLPVAATFYMPDSSGRTMESHACIDTMVRPPHAIAKLLNVQEMHAYNHPV